MSNKKRVWIISKYGSPTKHPRFFGIGKHFGHKGYPTTLFSSVSNSVAPEEMPKFKGWFKKEDHDGLRVFWMNGPKVGFSGFVRIFSWFWFELKLLLTFPFIKNKPNAVIASSLSLLSIWSGYVISKISGARFVLEIRDIWPLSLIELGGYSKSNLMIRFLDFTESFGYKKADVIVGTMPNLKEHVASKSAEWAGKVVCIPQGCDLSVFDENAVSLSEAYVEEYIPKEKFIVAYTGTLNPNNPIDSLFEVAAMMSEEFPQVHFLILGKGKNKDEYKRRAKSLPNVSFPPPILKNEMAHFLSFVDVGYDAFSSTLAKYGLSRNKWVDYMYNRCIIVCSYDGYQSMINECQAGYFVPYNDALSLKNRLVEIYRMPQAERGEMGDRARTYIRENRTLEKLGDQYLSYLFP